jgi:tetratricopeptide (TPR) repeat protein
MNPQLSWAYYCRSRGWYNKNDFNRAFADLTRAIDLDPRFAKAFGNRGLTRLRLGQTDEAEKDFAECLRLDPNLKPELERSIQATQAARAQP